MKDGNRIKELQKLMKGGEFIKPRCEIPLTSRTERQCFASITGCHIEPAMDPVNISEEDI